MTHITCDHCGKSLDHTTRCVSRITWDTKRPDGDPTSIGAATAAMDLCATCHNTIIEEFTHGGPVRYVTPKCTSGDAPPQSTAA